MVVWNINRFRNTEAVKPSGLEPGLWTRLGRVNSLALGKFMSLRLGFLTHKIETVIVWHFPNRVTIQVK